MTYPERILKLLHQNPSNWFTVLEVATLIGCSKATARITLCEMVEDNIVVQGRANRNKYGKVLLKFKINTYEAAEKSS
jgi:Fic family protein